MTRTVLSSLLTASSGESITNGEPTTTSVLVAYSPPVLQIAKAVGTNEGNEDEEEDEDDKEDEDDDDPIVPPN
jgi:ribosomal protein L12E/L44/L45/RPP1/RPP2